MEEKNLPIQSDISIADDFLLQVAEHAERRIGAVMKIKRVALKVTNPRDWTDQNGNPYLQVSGSEKIANLFNISWRIEEPIYDEESDGHFTWTYKGVFSLGGRTIEAIGTRSSKDTFFNKYEYGEKDASGKSNRTLLPPSAIDKGDVKKAAMTNLLGNGITRILGIRNLQWDDLKEFAEITREQVASIQYKKGGEKAPIDMPQEKGRGSDTETITVGVNRITQKDGKKADGNPLYPYVIHSGEKKYSTFSKTMAEEAQKSIEYQYNVIIEYKNTKYGNEIISLKAEEPPEPGSGG